MCLMFRNEHKIQMLLWPNGALLLFCVTALFIKLQRLTYTMQINYFFSAIVTAFFIMMMLFPLQSKEQLHLALQLHRQELSSMALGKIQLMEGDTDGAIQTYLHALQ